MAIPCEVLLHPEFLNNQQLIHIILMRQLRIPNIENMARDELLELFHNYCVPYGQRKYRDSGRGRILNKARPTSPEPAKNITLMNNNHKKKIARMNTDRLKPPPEVLSGQAKRIKLEHKASLPDPIDIDNNNKRKMSLEKTPATDSPPPKKDRKLITWP